MRNNSDKTRLSGKTKHLVSSCWYVYVVYIRRPAQRSVLFTDLMVAFLFVTSVGFLSYLYLIHRIPSTNDSTLLQHQNHYQRAIDKVIINNNLEIGHGSLNNLESARKIYSHLGHNKQRSVHKFPHRVLLLDKKRQRISNRVLQGVNRYISIGAKENANIFHNVTFTIQNPICVAKDNVTKIDLLILIFSAPMSRHSRDVLRNTWLSYSNRNTNNIRYVFLLGMSVATIQESVKRENAQYGDILQGDFQDYYRNLTMKTMMGLRWAVANCNQARFILKTDDDVWLNIPALLAYLKGVDPGRFTLGGKCVDQGRPHRNPNSRYYVPEEMYPLETYPPFCSGTGYLTTQRVASQIVNISNNMPYFYLEDVYVALCLAKLGIRVRNIDGFYNERTKNIPWCSLKTNKVLMVHRFNSNELRSVWMSRAKCPNTKRGLPFNPGFNKFGRQKQLTMKKKYKPSRFRHLK